MNYNREFVDSFGVLLCVVREIDEVNVCQEMGEKNIFGGLVFVRIVNFYMFDYMFNLKVLYFWRLYFCYCWL